jgi:hemerythrin-like domain-containing protein
MATTTNLRRQHDAALAMSDRLFDLMDGYDGRRDVFDIAMQLTKLVGLLRIHLAQEDVQLYPQLMASPDQDIARLACAYAREMGGLALELEIFAQHWSCSASIVGNFQEFREEANALLLHLAVRIEREDRYLYPLADAAENPTRKAA